MRPLSIAVAMLLLATTARAASPSPRDRSWSSKPLGITVEAPPGWTLTTHAGSPHVVVMLLHDDGARISVTVTPTEAREAVELAEQELRVLTGRGFRLLSRGPATRGGAELLFQPPRGSDRVRQIYLVRPVGNGRQSVVLTLTAAAATFAARSASLDVALTRLRLEEPPAPELRQAP